MTLKICFLSLLHRFDDTRVFYKEARSLAQAGFAVTHLAPGQFDSHWQDGVWLERYHPNEKKGIWGRLGRFFPLFRRALEIDADCYHCNEIESWPVGCLIKLFHPKKRIIFDVHEHYPSRFEHPMFPKWLDRIARPATLLLYRILAPYTDHFIFVNRAFALDFPPTEHKHSFILNYGLLGVKAHCSNNEATPRVVQEESTDHLTAVHIGGWGRARGWPQLLQALSLMKCQHLEVLSLGNITDDKAAFWAEAERLGVANRIHLEERVPYEQMFDYLLRANIGLILYQPGLQNHIFAFPQKLLDYMLAELPVIAPNYAIEVERLVQAEKCGLLIDPTKPEQIAQALDWLCENRSLAEEMGQRGKQAVIRQYNWEAEAKKLIGIYTNFAFEISKTK